MYLLVRRGGWIGSAFVVEGRVVPLLIEEVLYRELRLPNVERICEETGLCLGHAHLLGEPEYVGQLLEGVRKVNGSLRQVAAHFEEQEKQQA